MKLFRRVYVERMLMVIEGNYWIFPIVKWIAENGKSFFQSKLCEKANSFSMITKRLQSREWRKWLIQMWKMMMVCMYTHTHTPTLKKKTINFLFYLFPLKWKREGERKSFFFIFNAHLLEFFFVTRTATAARERENIHASTVINCAHISEKRKKILFYISTNSCFMKSFRSNLGENFKLNGSSDNRWLRENFSFLKSRN